MSGQFNPDKNLFSVAPIGQIIMIGRSISLRGGLTRDHALNLATWLLISANATPEEVKGLISDAMTGTPNSMVMRKTVQDMRRTIPQPPPPKAPVADASTVAPEVSGQVTPFIGEIDKEEAESIAAITTAAKKTEKIAVVSADDVAKAWGGSNG